ncbi:MAG: carboxypeptidase regulatory-like domain-containing protein [Candidatus Cloacimonetes bacterium]|nr:carboxypeptidase regulatory-like domain-containing protein [Candidatus Cloacimonadota bacterium]
MKKLIILIFLLFSYALILYSNPILPAVFSELYFDDNDNWYLELYDFYGFSPGNLDGCYLTSASSTAYFNNGIAFGCYDTLVVTNADMQTDFTINRNGTDLYIYGFFYDEMYWGDYAYSTVNAPYSGQSLARVVPYDDYFLLAKENQPSLGNNPFNVQTYGGIQGNVSDVSGYPVPNVQVDIISPISISIYTDEIGYFFIDGLYGMNYTLSAYKSGYPSVQMDVTVEPDSISNVSFVFVPQSVDPNPQENTVSISNHPNPFYNETEFQYSLPHNSFGSVAIFNSKGQKIKEIPVSPTENSVSWSGLDEKNKYVPSGVYFYNLECGDKILASGKMLYLR